MNYEIKITGSGTREEIIKSLQALITSISEIKGEDNATFFDATLCTEITEL